MAVVFVNAVLRRIIMSDAIIMIITFIFCCCCVAILLISMAWIDRNGAPWVYLKKLRTGPCYLCKYGQTVVERRDFSGIKHSHRKCMCPKYISYMKIIGKTQAVVQDSSYSSFQRDGIRQNTSRRGREKNIREPSN